ncbi:hypothetical protein PV367_19790 [Streptomyces europaeiscabiei]|uniref:Uncharacterized protein n=1 Tax=Streptomyces europaeiscabiei TaxID=146819 RepID=A0AAJ2PQV1_9ACTN|nr:hypothetical protein [Streptomyces europaeiscabiei]MDX3131982.1 hypothetical protein [Streptomyces europaeiscabiei]
MPHTERMHFDHSHLRSSGLPDDVGIRLDMNRAMVELPVADGTAVDGTAVDHWNLGRTARGRIEDPPSPSDDDKAAGLLGVLRRAHKSGGVPTIHDPSRGHQS